MSPSSISYPARSYFVRWQLVNSFQVCPQCGGGLDAGLECDSCEKNYLSFLRKAPCFNQGEIEKLRGGV